MAGILALLIPLAAILGVFITKWLRMKFLEHDRRVAQGRADGELAETVRRLEARVANLERAVTTTEAERKFTL